MYIHRCIGRILNPFSKKNPVLGPWAAIGDFNLMTRQNECQFQCLGLQGGGSRMPPCSWEYPTILTKIKYMSRHLCINQRKIIQYAQDCSAKKLVLSCLGVVGHQPSSWEIILVEAIPSVGNVEHCSLHCSSCCAS